MFMNNFRNKAERFIKITSLVVYFILGCLFFTISQKDTLYLDCNLNARLCTIGEIKNGKHIINREIKYSEIKGYYVYNSPKGYFSSFDRMPQTTFALKITKNNKDENILLPFIGRVDWMQADKIYNNILDSGIQIKQENNYGLFFQTLALLCFILFFMTTYTMIFRNKKLKNIAPEQLIIEENQEEIRVHPKVKQQRKIKEIQKYIEEQNKQKK